MAVREEFSKQLEEADRSGIVADLQPGKKQLVSYGVTYKRRKMGPNLSTERKRESL